MLPSSSNASRRISPLSSCVPESPYRPASVLLVGIDPANGERVTQALNGTLAVSTVCTRTTCDCAARFIREARVNLLIVGSGIIEQDSDALINLQAHTPSDVPMLMLVDSSNGEIKERALGLGILDFIDRPFCDVDVVARVKSSLRHGHLVRPHAHQNSVANLDGSPIHDRIEQLKASRQDLLFCLARAGEHPKSETNLHLLRVGMYVGAIAEELGFDPAQVQLLEQAALLHDVGKLYISDLILLKPSELSAREYQRMQLHCEFGRDIIQSALESKWRVLGCYRGFTPTDHSSDIALLTVAAQIAYSHHERWDGTGYPQGLAGEAIPIEARITAVADVFDALCSRRPYKSAFMPDACLRILQQEKQKHFDPRVVDAFLSCRDRIWSIRQNTE